MAVSAELEKQKNQADSLLVELKKEQSFPFSEGGIAAMAAAVLEKYKPILQKDEGSAPAVGIGAIVAAAALRKHKKQAELPLMGTKKEEHTPFSGGDIAAMAAAAALEKQKQIPQRDGGSAPVGSIAAMTAAAVLRKQNNQSESSA